MTEEELQVVRTERRIFRHQIELVTKECGKRRADDANYGWFVDEVSEPGVLVYQTKVYGDDPQILTTRARTDWTHKPHFEDSWKDYN